MQKIANSVVCRLYYSWALFQELFWVFLTNWQAFCRLCWTPIIVSQAIYTWFYNLPISHGRVFGRTSWFGLPASWIQWKRGWKWTVISIYSSSDFPSNKFAQQLAGVNFVPGTLPSLHNRDKLTCFNRSSIYHCVATTKTLMTSTSNCRRRRHGVDNVNVVMASATSSSTWPRWCRRRHGIDDVNTDMASTTACWRHRRLVIGGMLTSTAPCWSNSCWLYV
jgi:hypothetical protein